MRKARSRRKQGIPSGNGGGNGGQRVSTPPGSTSSDGKGNSSSPNSTGGRSVASNGERRKPVTPEEAALTAKNYRLAKELNDLRTRHRDETNKNSKLSMDNMNLASRVRSAITHIEALKKELSSQKRRISSLQRRKGEADLSPMSANSSQSEKSEKENENIAFNPTFSNEKEPAQDHKSVDADSTIQELDTNEKNQKQNITGRELNDNIQSGKGDNSTKERVKIKNSPFGDLKSTDFFSNSFQTSLNTTSEKDKGAATTTDDSGESDFSSFQSENGKPIVGIAEDGQSEENSIDAFEASFSTTFPSAFEAFSSAKQTPDIPEPFQDDPFFPGSSTDVGEREPGSLNGKGRGNSPPPPHHRRRTRRSGDGLKKHKPVLARIESTRIENNGESQSDNNIDLFPENAMGGFEAFSSTEIQTPPKKNKRSTEQGDSPPPPPTEKSGAKAARARYDAAYGEKKDKSKAEDPGQNPSLVLRRLQQRKVSEKEKSPKQKKVTKVEENSLEKTPMQQRSGSESNRIPPNLTVDAKKIESISDEIKKLDAIANPANVSDATQATSEQAIQSKPRRRNVKQPISYSEPSLNSKLRRGDVFFVKETPTNEVMVNDDGKHEM